MFEPKTVILAVVLATPFGLAIHEDATRTKPDIDSLALGASLYGDLTENPYADDRDDRLAEIDRLLAAADDDLYDDDLEAEPPEPPEPPESMTARALSAGALDQLFAAERGTVGPALAQAHFGLNRAQLEQQAPALRHWGERSDELGRIQLYAEFAANNQTEFSNLVLEIPDPDLSVETYLRERWGAPQIETVGELPAIWISPDGHTRVAVSGLDEIMSVVLSPTISVEELLTPPADGDGVFSFETGPALLGGELVPSQKSYPRIAVDAYFQDHARLDLAGISSDPGASPLTRVTMAVKSGVIESVSLKIGCGERCADVVAAFEARFGARKLRKDIDQIYTFKGDPRVKLTIYAHEQRLVAVEVVRR